MTERGSIDVKQALQGLLDVAKVALKAEPDIPTDEAAELLFRLLAIVERSMPADLQVQDIRVMRARLALNAMRQ